MEWVIHLDAPNRPLVVKVTGTIRAEPLRQMTCELRDALQQHQCKQVLLDYTEAVSGLQPYEIFERPKVLLDLDFPSDVEVAVLYLGSMKTLNSWRTFTVTKASQCGCSRNGLSHWGGS